MAECEAVLLGREPIHGSANATALATLVKMLMRKSDLRRKYVLRCNRDNGLQMTPYRRLDDEGFESDEDLTSLGSYEDNSSSMYVSDHAVRVKMNAQQKSSQNTDATSGSVSSVGTDSANSSGASDNDDTDNSLSHNVNQASFDKKKDDSECFSFHEVAFCHVDPSLPKVIVWVVKTKRPSKTANEYSYGLEAIVFLCHNEEKFRTLYKNFQELSRRQKLDKPVRNRWKEDRGGKPTVATTVSKIVNHAPKPDTKMSGNAVMFNLVQRVDTDGVTHIEVTRPVPDRQPRVLSNCMEPSSIISINTPDSGDIKTVPKKAEKIIESVIRTDVDAKNETPERPERKKQYKKDKAPPPPPPQEPKNQKPSNKEKVVRGQFVRVSVDPKTISSPMPRGVWLFGSEAKPCGSALSYPSRLVWNNHDKVEEYESSRKSRKTERGAPHHRSKSSVILRRPESPKRYPMSHRYIDTIQINNSLPNRFFGKLKELTGSNLHSGNKFRRRNSIGDLTNPNFYQQDTRKFDKYDHSLAKSTPNLKSVIKNKNGKFYKDGYNEEPKKVTFSAYATVQVVD